MPASEGDLAAEAAALVYQTQTVGNSTDALPGYVVEQVFEDQWDNTGFHAVAFANADNGHAIIAIRGSEDRLDFIADANVGIAQYKTNRSQLIDYAGARVLGNRLVLAGHSLGGGLSQYLGYDLAKEFPAFREQICVQTQNGLGGIVGISRLHERYDAALLEGVTVRNYRHPADPISRIGGQAGGNVLELTGPEAARRGPLFAHSIDRFLARGGVSALAAAVPAADMPFDITHTLEEIGPDLSAALSEILGRGTAFSGLRQIFGLFRRLSAEDRAHVGRLLGDLLPIPLLPESRRDRAPPGGD